MAQTTTTFATDCFRTELELTLGWETESVTLKTLASAMGAGVDRVRYHVLALAKAGRVVLSKDSAGRVLVALPAPLRRVDHGTVRRCLNGAAVCAATDWHVERAQRSARREMAPRSGAPEPGLGVIYVDGLRCWVEPPVELAA
jgi:hypothetical protein